MTVLKTITLRSGRFRPHYDSVTPDDTAMMLDYIAAAHGRWCAVASREAAGHGIDGAGTRDAAGLTAIPSYRVTFTF